MSKLKLNTETLIDGFYVETHLLGIVAPIEIYKIIWHINRLTGYNFRINHELEIRLLKKSRNYFFSVYQYKTQNSNIEHYFYNNEDDGEYLLPEFKHLDFLWLTRGEQIEKDELAFIKQSLKNISYVQLVTEMTFDKIKNKEHLIL